jgi:hypothetical protein
LHFSQATAAWGIKLLIHLPIEARKHQKNLPGRAIDAAEIHRQSGTIMRVEGLTWLWEEAPLPVGLFLSPLALGSPAGSAPFFFIGLW